MRRHTACERKEKAIDPMEKYGVKITKDENITDNNYHGFYRIYDNTTVGGCIYDSGFLWEKGLTERDVLNAWIADGKPCITNNEIAYD